MMAVAFVWLGLMVIACAGTSVWMLDTIELCRRQEAKKREGRECPAWLEELR